MLPRETLDHLMVWFPSRKALFLGNLVYEGFPMLGSRMKPYRPVLAWAPSLDCMRELHPGFMVPSFAKPSRGIDAIDVTPSPGLA
jgi:hypothetical protein